jgi:hypothetical protein
MFALYAAHLEFGDTKKFALTTVIFPKARCLTKTGEFETLRYMPQKPAKRREKKLKSKVIITEGAIVIPLSEEHRKKVRETIRKKGEASFKIEEIKVKAIPATGLTSAWIQC